nr:sugar ABC transporter ATP-binding protein [uncultured Cohaesibacter sp.]
MAELAEYAVSVSHISKSFGGVKALKDVTLRVKPGTVHALVGENGAGKSTLMNILAGILKRDKGSVKLFGEEVNFTGPSDSQNHGIAIIHQELALASDLTVAENMFLGNLGQGKPLVKWKDLNEKASQALKEFGFDISPDTLCGDLSVAYQQVVEITKSLVLNDCKVLIMDEPSAVLAGPEVEILFTNLRRLREKGVAIIYISHRLEEIFRIADAITVFKDGETVIDLDPATCTEEDIITNMVGRKMDAVFPKKVLAPKDSPVSLSIEHLNRPGVLSDISLQLRKGEVVGMSGLIGSGRSELARCIFGIDSYASGEIIVHGKPARIHRPADAMKQGIGLIPEDRKLQGGILSVPIQHNLSMSSLGRVSNFGFFNGAADKALANESKEQLKIRLGSILNELSSLSGGNQQKVVVAKWLNAQTDILILDEPTRGVDVGAKAEIYAIIAELASKGYSIIVISSELVEVVGLCHRVYVMSEGEITGELTNGDINEENIMRLAIPKRISK